MKKSTETKQTKVDSQAEAEKVRILQKAHQKTGKQLSINSSGKLESKNEIEKMISGIADNPERKYEIYYKVIQRILRQYLPKGKENYKARKFVYEEKNVYLTRGRRLSKYGIRGHDSRMTYISDAKEIMSILLTWVGDMGTPVDLYIKLRDLNVAKGYGMPPVR